MADSTYIQETEGTITHSMLQAFMECEYYFYHLYITKQIKEEQSDAQVFGSAFDCYITSPQRYEDKYASVPRRLGKSDKIELTLQQGRMIPRCLEEFRRQPLFSFDPRNSGNINNDRILVQYKGEVLSYKPDQYNPDEAILSDIKTSASLENIDRYLSKYKMQLTFGQYLIQIRDDILVDGTIQVVTREEPARSQFYFASKQSLMDNRRVLIDRLDAMILAKKSGVYQSCNDRVHCPAYGFDPCTIQKEYIFL